MWLLLAVGCVPPTVLYRTPRSADPLPDQVAPARVQYEILAAATGKQCGDLKALAVSGNAQLGGVHPVLYEGARFAALESVPAADNLMYVRVKAETDGYEQCVTVTGRAYRVLDMATGNPRPEPTAAAAPPPVQ